MYSFKADVPGAVEPGRQSRQMPTQLLLVIASYGAMLQVHRKQSGCSDFPGSLLGIVTRDTLI